MEEGARPKVHTPTRRPRIREGRGFSLGEIRRAGLTPHEAKRWGIPLDKRRRTTHTQNVQVLKEQYGAVVPLTEIKGIGTVTERGLIDVGILDAYDLVHADLDDLSKRVPHSKKTLRGWQADAKRLLRG